MEFRESNEARNYDPRREPSTPPPPSKPTGQLKRSISTMRLKVADIFKEAKEPPKNGGQE